MTRLLHPDVPEETVDRRSVITSTLIARSARQREEIASRSRAEKKSADSPM
jgi:hypothetical protein